MLAAPLVAGRSRTMRLVASAAVLALALATTNASAGAKPKPAGTFVGQNCVETENVFLRPPSALAPYLPEGFTPRTVWPELSELLILITSCESGTVNGKSVGPLVFSEVAIYIQDPERLRELGPIAASVDHQYYQVWHLTDAAALRRVMAKVGVDGDLVSGGSVETPSGVQVEANMPWERVPYSFTGTRGVPTAVYYPRPSNFWHSSKKGLAVTMYPMPTGEVEESGAARLDTPPDGILAEMAGSATGVPDGSSVFTYETLKAETVLLHP
jgi:hypothetical protein